MSPLACRLGGKFARPNPSDCQHQAQAQRRRLTIRYDRRKSRGMDLDHVPEHAKAGLAAMNAGKPLAYLTKETKPQFARDLVERYLDGEEIADLAKELHVTPDRLYQLLIEGDSESWRSAQAAKALNSFFTTRAEMKASQDGLGFAQAREAHKSSQWELEKLLRRLFGDDKTAINVNAAGNVQIQVVSFAEQTDTASQQSQRTIENGES